jgi:flagellar hook assembly protein FlgD
MERYTPSIYYAFSYILRQEKPSSVTESEFKELSFESIKGYPNPFNSASTISFNIIETSIVQLKVYNTLGKEINLLLNKELSPGNYSITWDVNDKNGDSLPSGIYLIVLRTKNSVKAFKSVLLK